MTEHELIIALSIERFELLAEIKELKRERNYWWEMYKKRTKVNEAPETDITCEVTEP